MFTIHTKPNRLMPASSFDIPADKIICNDVMLPAEIDKSCSFNPNHIRLWVVGNEYAAMRDCDSNRGATEAAIWWM